MVLPVSHKVSRVSWYSGSDLIASLFTYRTITFYDGTFQFSSLRYHSLYDLSATPGSKFSGLGSFRFARRYLGNRFFFLFLRVLRCFSSPGLPSYTYVFSIRYIALAMWVSPFGNLRITGYLRLPVAYRSLSRPSSASSAKAFTMRSL